jgi:hypothetical protein
MFDQTLSKTTSKSNTEGVGVFVHAALKWLLPLLHHLFLCEGTSSVSIRRKSGAAAAVYCRRGEGLSDTINSFFSQICKRFTYHCIKYKSLNKHSTRFYRAPKEVDLTQPMLDHLSNRPHISILNKKTTNTDVAVRPRRWSCVFVAAWTSPFQRPGRARPVLRC